MSTVMAWLRLELRRRWRSLTVLALLIAVSGAVVMTSLAAARRGASSLTRLHDRTLPTTIALLPNTPGFDWAPIRALPEVAVLSTFVVDYTMSIDGVSGNGLGFPFSDDQFMNTIERPVVFEGRLPDPNRPDEAVVTRKFVKNYHKGVGDTVIVRLPSAKQLVDSQTGATPTSFDGPVIPTRIVGVVVSPWISDSPDSDGGIQVSNGLVAKYPRETIGDPSDPEHLQFVNALVRLKGEGAAIDAFRRDVERVTKRTDIGSFDLVEMQRDVQHDIDFESRCLVAFGIAALVAALFLVGQAIVRYAATSTSELQTLRALGMTPRQATTTAAAAPTIVGMVGAGLAVVGAWLASRWFPFGTADFYEPSPGRSWDWLVMVVGFVVIVALVVLGAALAARVSLGFARRGSAGRRSAVAVSAGRAGASVPVLIGIRFALEPGRGRTSVPARPALIGAVIGVLGVLAAFTFSQGVSDAASHPERFGQTAQIAAFVGINDADFGGPSQKVVSALEANKLVTGVDDARTSVATTPDGNGEVALWEYNRTTKPMDVVVLSGHLPEAVDEVLLAPKTLSALHVHVGGMVQLVGGTKTTRTLRISGSGLIPEGPHNGYADGGWITSAGYESLFTGFKYHVIFISVPHGKNLSAAAAQLTTDVVAAVPEAADGLEIGPVDVPSEIAEIRQVRTLPIVLGGFLALLAVAAVGHALATAVRRRSHDLAVLRALGMTQWQCRWVVVTQATVLAIVGVAFGLPIGFAIGRTLWRVVADYTPIEYVPPLDVWALVLIGPAALLVANALAAWPGRRAARMRIAMILRAE